MKSAVVRRGLVPGDNENVDAAQSKADAGQFLRETPKNYLMAWLLVILKDPDRHGYEIIKALKENVVVSGPGTVYSPMHAIETNIK